MSAGLLRETGFRKEDRRVKVAVAVGEAKERVVEEGAAVVVVVEASDFTKHPTLLDIYKLSRSYSFAWYM